MHMTFKAARSSKTATGKCDVSVFMPARELVDALYDADTVVRVLAGWVDSGAVEVAQGTVVLDSVRDQRSGSRPAVSFQISSAKAATARASVSKAWAQVNASEVIDYLRTSMGIPADIIDLPTDVLYARGHAVERSVSVALDEVTRDCGAQWSVVDGRLRVWPIGGTARRTAEVWSSASGLLEVAAPRGGGKVGARCLLAPNVRVGDTIRIEDESWSGDIATDECMHEGDTHGQAWYTSVSGVSGD